MTQSILANVDIAAMDRRTCLSLLRYQLVSLRHLSESFDGGSRRSPTMQRPQSPTECLYR